MNVVNNIFFYFCIINTYNCKIMDFDRNTLIETSRKCIKMIVEENFNKNPIITIFRTNLHQDSKILEDILSPTKYIKKVYNFTNYKIDFNDEHRDFAIITTRSLNDLLEYNREFYNINLWNARAKYIIYSLTNSEEILQKFVDLVWYYYILNAIIVMPSKDSETLKIFSWFPYSNKSCGKDIYPVLVDEYASDGFKYHTSLFSEKVPLYSQNCPLKIQVVNSYSVMILDEDIEDDKKLNLVKGVEVGIMDIIGSIVHLNIEYYSFSVPFNWGVVTMQGNASGIFKSIIDKRADVGFGQIAIMEERRLYCDSSLPTIRESFVIAVPTPKEVLKWRKIFQPFTTTTWLAVIGNYLIVSTIILYISSYKPIDTMYNKIKSSFLNIFAIFLGLASHNIPIKFSGKMIFFFYIVFALNFVVAYQAKLIEVLINPRYEKQISNIHEFLASNLKLEVTDAPSLRVRLSSDPEFQNIDQTVVGLDSDSFERIAYDKNIALFTFGPLAYIDSLKYRHHLSESMIYIIDYLSTFSQWYMTKGFPFRDRMNQIMNRMKDSGFFFKVENDIHDEWSRTYRDNVEAADQIVLTMPHLQGAFYILFIGLGSAFAVFIVELGAKYFWDRKL